MFTNRFFCILKYLVILCLALWRFSTIRIHESFLDTIFDLQISNVSICITVISGVRFVSNPATTILKCSGPFLGVYIITSGSRVASGISITAACTVAVIVRIGITIFLNFFLL